MKCVFPNRSQPTLICFKRFHSLFEWCDQNCRKHNNQRCWLRNMKLLLNYAWNYVNWKLYLALLLRKSRYGTNRKAYKKWEDDIQSREIKWKRQQLFIFSPQRPSINFLNQFHKSPHHKRFNWKLKQSYDFSLMQVIVG